MVLYLAISRLYILTCTFKNGIQRSKTGCLQKYILFKHNFKLDKYLKLNIEEKYKTALARFRTSSHNIAIETGRYENISRDQRTCISCNMKVIEDEYHFLSVCPKHRELRIKYFKQYFCQRPTIHKLEFFLSATSKTIINNLA